MSAANQIKAKQSFSRRNFLKIGVAGVAGLIVLERSYDYLSESTVRAKIVIVGGGAAGITMSAYLSDMLRHVDITIIEPSDTHYYQPGYTLIAALSLIHISEPTRLG